MMTFYKITLSGGMIIDVQANSAADAIGKALYDYRGQTIKRCYSGTEHSGLYAGIIEYEIPKHEPIPVHASKPGRRKDTTLMMFDEHEMNHGRLSK